MPDQPDSYSELLGEGSGGGPLAAIGRFGRALHARQTGQDIVAAQQRQQQRNVEGQRLHDDALSAATYGMNEFFTPERVKYAKSLGVDLTGLQDITQKRAQLMQQDDAETQAMMGAGGPAATPSGGGTAPTPSGPTLPESTPAPAAPAPQVAGGGAGPAAGLTKSPLTPASTAPGNAPMPPMVNGQPDWKNHDWAAHIEQETQEEKALYQKAQFYLNRGRKAEQFGLPGADGMYKMGAFYAQQYESRMKDRLGFERSAALQQQSQAFERVQQEYVQGQENGRAQLSKELAEKNMTTQILERESDQVIRDTQQAQINLAKAGISDPDQIKPLADAFNQRVDHLAQEAKKAGIPFDPSSLRQQVVTTESPSWWRSALGLRPARSSTLGPEGSRQTQEQINQEGDAATVVSSPGARSSDVAPVPKTTPAKAAPTSLTEGTIIRNPRTGERRRVVKGQLVPVEETANAQ